MRQSGGQVRTYSEAGRGTMVCLCLARHFGEIEKPELAAKPFAMEALAARIRALIVVR